MNGSIVAALGRSQASLTASLWVNSISPPSGNGTIDSTETLIAAGTITASASQAPTSAVRLTGLLQPKRSIRVHTAHQNPICETTTRLARAREEASVPASNPPAHSGPTRQSARAPARKAARATQGLPRLAAVAQSSS